MSDVGNEIKKMRERKGISQYKLAKMSGVSQPTISAIEGEDQTRSPSIDTVIKIAKALSCTVSELTGETEIGREIALRRKALRISQSELSRRAGLKQTTISAIERGINKPAYETILLISEALGCQVGDLFGCESGPGSADLTMQEKSMLDLFRQLNADGREILLKYAESILTIPALMEIDTGEK